MALLDVALGQSDVVYVDTTDSPGESDLVSVGALNSDTTVYYGDGALDFGSTLSANVISSNYIVATGGADLTFDAGLLDLSLGTSNAIVIDGDSSVTIDAGTVGVASVVTNIFSDTEIAFSGSGDGTFTYIRPDVGLLTSTTISVTEMAPGDQIVIPIDGDGTYLDSDAYTLREVGYDEEGEVLTLVNGTGLNSVYVEISMTQEEYDLYAADKSAYLDGSSDTFTFPGADDSTGEDDDGYVIPCFAAGTLIKTQRGEVPVEKLTAGDLVLTLDHGYAPISWVGSRQLHAIDLARNPNLRPIRIQSGALGENQPEQDLVVSPQHRVLVRSAVAERMFGSLEVLVAAKHLVGIPGVQVEDDIKEVSYWHFMFKAHELVFSGGAVTESMYAGPQALKSISDEARDELLTLFPELRSERVALPQPARQLIPGRSGRQLAFRLAKNSKVAVEAA
jgi:hypothetical protein